MMTKKKAFRKIVLFMGDHARHVCPIIRVIAPARMAGLEVFQGNERINGKITLHLDRIAEADLVILQRDFPVDLEAYECVVQEARDSGKQILYDIDDLLIDLPEDHPDTARYLPGRFPVLRAIAEADAVTVASTVLKVKLQDFNPNIHVLSNYLPDEIWGKIQPITRDAASEDRSLIIGYMGGHSHRPDLDLLEPVLRRILDRYGEGIRLQFWGIEPPPGLAGDSRVRAAHLEYADYNQFSEYLSQQESDIFIAPLKDSPFNRSKSWLKFLEYSALGVPGIYSNLEPYRDIVQHGKTGYLASTLDEWHEYITALIEDPSLRKKIGEKAFQDVRKNYMLSDHAHQWKELYARASGDREVEISRAYLENSLWLASRWHAEIDADRVRKEKELISAREEAQGLTSTIHAQQEELTRIQKAFDDITVQHDEVNKMLAHFNKLAAEQSQKIGEQEKALLVSSVYKTSRFLRFASKLQHRWTSFRMGILRRLVLRRVLPLFDPEWYRSQWLDVAQAGVDPYIHYLQSGWREGRNPSPYFDVIWYLRTYPDVLEAGVEPLGHYIHHGRWENRRPHPELPKDYFPIHQSIWLPIQHRPDAGKGGWRKPVAFRWKQLRLRLALRNGRVDVPPFFDAEWYLAQNPDVAQRRTHPYLHYLILGWKEGRDPHPNFNVRRYLENNPDVRDAGIEPFEHFCTYGWLEGRNPRPEIGTTAYMLGNRHDHYFGLAAILSIKDAQHPAPAVSISAVQESGSTLQVEAGRLESSQDLESAIARRVSLSTYEPEELIQIDSPPVKLIAFYLPQFHPIPENDEFWGEGFTEWTNVAKARPLFDGHYQPRLPGDLGFYDLRLVEVIEKQVEMAKAHGIYGFCFHHYWFNGKRVLERPVDQFLDHPEIDIQFCLNWANENWTRRWDGQDDEILLRQDHSPEDDLAFITDAMRYFKDPRYIRIENKPLFILYNPQRLDNSRETAVRWRNACREEGFDGIYLVAAQTFGFKDPYSIGFNAAVEFPPHNAYKLVNITEQIKYFGDFEGFVVEYDGLIDNYKGGTTDYPLYKTVTPSWDNTARRGLLASVYENSTPKKYQDWLESAIRTTISNRNPDERFLFINAWNEWAESAYLEPDREFGYAYLNATSRALQVPYTAQPKIVFIGHDAYRAGSQIVLLNILRWLKAHTHINLRILLGRGGALEEEYKCIAPTLILDDILDHPAEKIDHAVKRLCGDDVRLIYANSSASGWILPYLASIEAPILTHIHELQESIDKFVGEETISLTKSLSDRFIAVSPPVKQNLIRTYGINEEKIELVYPFIEPKAHDVSDIMEARRALDLDVDSFLVFGCGSVDWRKGPDLYIEVAEELHQRGLSGFHFYWIGKDSGEFLNVREEIQERGLDGIVTFLGEKKDPRAFFSLGDLFLLTSREDPYPLVVLEAADCGLATVCFKGTGGMPAFITEEGEESGFVVPFGDAAQMADKVELLIQDSKLRKKLGETARRKLHERHTVDIAVPQILKIIRSVGRLKPGVSVIVPTFNHARYLPSRLDSIFQQTYRDVEVRIIDDASTDGTVDILARYASRPEVTIEINQENSGSTFAQWARGIRQAQAELLWIAEDDDYCEPTFLERLMPFFSDPDVMLAYCQSYAVDEEGQSLFSYKGYTDEISVTRWERSYVADAEDEVNLGLAVKNTIPNASAVVFRKFDINEWAEDWVGKNLAGDWALYMHAIRQGKIAYSLEHLNYHRRHRDTNIHRTRLDERRFLEYVNAQKLALSLYDISNETRARMRDAAYGIWKEVFPEKDYQEFEPKYIFGILNSEALLSNTSSSNKDDMQGSIYLRYRDANNDDWYRTILKTQYRSVIDGIVFPGFPPAELQRKTVGRDGENALYQAYQFYRLVKRYLEQTGISLGDDARICDFGCGWGRIMRFFLKDIPLNNIIGLDPSVSFIEESQRTFPQGKFRVIPHQPPYVNIETDYFDLIFAYSVFSHLNPRITKDIIEEFGRIIKPGGLVILTSRGKEFMAYCETLRSHLGPLETDYEEQLRWCFTNIEADIEQYELGYPIFYSYSGEDVTQDDIYGEAAYPVKYIEDEFRDIFQLIATETECPEKDLDQVTMVLQRKDAEPGNTSSNRNDLQH